MKATVKLRALLAEDGLILAGGAHDAMTAQLVEQVGFRLCVVTGAGTSVCRGYPDIGLLSMEEMVNNARYIAEGVNIPVIVDAGIGTASDATLAMELGCDGVLLNTAIAGAQNPVLMAAAMRQAVKAGRSAYLAGRMPKSDQAAASSPIEGVINS